MCYSQNKFLQDSIVTSDENFIEPQGRVIWSNDSIQFIGNINVRHFTYIEKKNGLVSGLLCFNLYKSKNLWKAKILTTFNMKKPEGMILVQYVDYDFIRILFKDKSILLQKDYSYLD
jgi:hypothetical protein